MFNFGLNIYVFFLSTVLSNALQFGDMPQMRALKSLLVQLCVNWTKLKNLMNAKLKIFFIQAFLVKASL